MDFANVQDFKRKRKDSQDEYIAENMTVDINMTLWRFIDYLPLHNSNFEVSSNEKELQVMLINKTYLNFQKLRMIYSIQVI